MSPLPDSSTSPAPLLLELERQLGSTRVLSGPVLLERNTADWSEAEASAPLALVLPRNTEEVALALRICRNFDTPVAIQGGLTGLAGGANVQPGEVAVSLARLDKIEALDQRGGTAIVQAGVTLQALQEAAGEVGLMFPLDLGARGSCQLGGNAATNAGGNRVLRFGMMRNLVLGLEVVLADGTVLSMLDSVVKNNAGYDLKQLFIGSEGTLGVITRLSLALTPRPAWQGTALCAVSSFEGALAMLQHAKSGLPGLSAFELMWQDFFEAAARARSASLPFAEAHPLYVLVEALAGSEEQGQQQLEDMLGSALERGIVLDAIVAQSHSQVEQLWAYREGVSELLSLCKPCAAFDVSVAIPRMDELVAELRTHLRRDFPSQNHLFFGHLGDGNLHLIAGPFRNDAELEAAEDLVYACVGKFSGSISAEHGIGMVKRGFLHHSRTEAELVLMRQLKNLMDPAQILNRGRILAPQP